MNQKVWKDRLFVSGIDQNAFKYARRLGLGYEIAEFCWAPRMDAPEELRQACERVRGVDRLWFHAPFAELCPCAIDPQVRELTARRYRQAIALAARLGSRRIVIHGGFIPHVYFPEWYVEQSVSFWKEFLTDMPENTRIALENVMEPSPEMNVQIVSQVNDPRLGLCLDVGHANTCVSQTPPRDWIAPMAPWLFHVHLHNNFGEKDLHLPLGEGSVDMEEILRALQDTQATLTLENPDCRPSLLWLQSHGYLQEEAL